MSFERRLKKRIMDIDDLSAITPGLVIEVHQRGRKLAALRAGDTYKYYDLASLTKILFTATFGIFHFSDYPRDLEQSLSTVLPWWKKRKVTPAKLFTHTAGLEWWVPMYKKLRGPMVPDVRWAQLKRELAKLKTKTRTNAVYSDIDLWMLGCYFEAVSQKSLTELWAEVAERTAARDMFFHPGNKPRFARKLYAPTEDCPWRGRILQGEVHDENTWALAGVAPHAGLFGTIGSVSKWGLELRRGYLGESRVFRDQRMLRHFVNRRVPRAVGDWGLGFMKPSRPTSSCGRYFSLRSFGHTGFTGTSVWFDPKRDLLVTILSNRVHPTRENKRFVDLRRELHDWVVESL